MPGSSMRARFIRIAAMVGVLGLLLSPALTSTAQEATGSDPKVNYLFGSGSNTGGRQLTLRVRLDSPAPSGGATVVLTSGNTAAVPIQGSVEVPAGQTEETFKVNTNPVFADVNVQLSASFGGATKSRSVLIKEPDLRVVYVQGVIRGGGLGKVTICLKGAATPGGIVVNLSSSVPATFPAPATATILAGKECLVLKPAASEVTDDVPVTITASYDGITKTGSGIVRNFPDTGSPTVTPDPTPGSPTVTSTPTATADPTATNTPTATATPVPPVFTIALKSGTPVPSGGIVTFDVCLVSGANLPYDLTFGSTADEKAAPDLDTATFSALAECEEATLTDLEGGTSSAGLVSLEAFLGGDLVQTSAQVQFPGDPATPTATSTATATATPEPTSTSTATATATATATSTSTPTATATATSTATATPDPTSTSTPTATATSLPPSPQPDAVAG